MAGIGARPTAASGVANGPLSGFLSRLWDLPALRARYEFGVEAAPGGRRDSLSFRRPSLPARICGVAERRLTGRRHRANFRSAGSPWRREMTLPLSSRFQLTGDLGICRILNGMWQVSGAHGHIDPARAVGEIFASHDAGFTTWDLADHYGPAEEFIGDFRRRFIARYGAERLSEIQAFTKWVPRPGRMTRSVVEDAIGTSLSRMGVKCLDLLQFHWWDYADRSYLDALRHLADLQREGKIRHLALTNFDNERLGIIADHGVPIVSNQVQYSLIDRRPAIRIASFCRGHAMTLLAYGTLLGSLLSEEYLGRPEPRRPELDTASLQKYNNMIDAW